MEIKFSTDELNEINNIKSKYPNNKAAIMPVLWFAQNKFGYISDEVIIYLSELLNISASEIEGIVSFYTMFHRQPVGKYHIQVCTNVSCMVRGGVKLLEYVSDKYKLNNMETTEDGMFSIEEVECMGACGGAPMIAINEDYYENITIEKLNEILDNLK